ncbi:MAG: hypothetical protein Q4C10_03565 [Clostridia bacterium]|nr:hypothetical protein [Clostridia bacterium]
MSKSKRAARQPQGPAPREKKNPFLNTEGALRTGWLLTVSLLCCAAVALGARLALAAGCSALFRAWNVNAENAWRAPGWARLFYAWQGSAVSAAVSALLLAACLPLRRLWRMKALKNAAPFDKRLWDRSGSGWKGLLWPGCAGLMTAVAVGLLCLIPDSSRLSWPIARPNLTPGLPALAAVSLLGVLAEECFTKGVLYDGLCPRWGRAWATAWACAAFFALGGGLGGSAVSAINVALLGLVGCALYERFGLWAAAGFRWFWGNGCAFLLGFGGSDAAVYRLYQVSETLLTGGDSGPMYGLWATALLLLWLALLNGRWLKDRARRAMNTGMARRPNA